MSVRFLIEEVLAGSARAVADACLDEDARLIQRRKPTDRDNYRRSRVAAGRYSQHKSTYKRAFKTWQRTPRAKMFYKKLARWNQRHQGWAKGRIESGTATADALLEFFGMLCEEFAGDAELGLVGELAGYLADELMTDVAALRESFGAIEHHYHWAPYYYDWYAGFLDELAQDPSGRPD